MRRCQLTIKLGNFNHSQKSKKMKNSELIAEIAERACVTETTAKRIIDAQAEIITEQLQKGDVVVLHVSLGKFKAEGKPERPGRNPSNGEIITIPAKIKPSFQVSKALKDALN